MKPFVALLCLAPLALHAHTTDSSGLPMDKEMLRKHIADEFMAKRMALAKEDYKPTPKPVIAKPVQLASMMTNLAMLAQGSTLTAPGNGELMSASFLPFKPKLRFYNDANYFYIESDGIPDRTRQPNLMVGITTWQQQVPMPVSYFIGTTNGTNNAGSLGFGQPNVWKLPLVPVPAASPISLNGNFLRGAVALGSDGVPIFNPRNNTGQFSYDIGELDIYGGHCGLADDYHYHIYPVHLIPVLGNDKPIAWALDGYPVYGYVEPDGSPMQTLDADGGHDHGTWGYHYHARGTYNSGTASWTPTNPFMMNAMHGVVVNFDSQIDPQPSVSNMRASGTGGYTAQQVPGAAIIAFKNPVALSVDGSGHFIENVSGTPSEDDFLMRYTVSSVTYDVCWRLNRKAVPKSYTMTYRHPTTGTTTTTYTSNGNRVTTYPMSGKSMIALPDTSQTGNFTGSAGDGEDSDYTINAQAFTNNGNGTITDNVTGLMWQSVDNGESTWENAVANAASVTTGGYNDWRLPTPHELFCLFNHQVSNPALNTAFFPNNPVARAGYWWSSDLYGTSTTNVWCTNEGGGLGPKPKSETISAGGTLRYHARYARGAKQTNGHNYVSNNDGTVTDLDTGLMWKQVPRTATTWSTALADIEGLTDAGFSDWRMPNVKEMESLVDYTMTTFTSLTNIKPPAHRLLFPSATATSYWTSTTQNNDALAALVVEFGLNTTSNPPRNAQGIISHEPKTSSYPVFAVRTAALTPTQIAVSQGATTLTDGLSTVGYGSVNVGSTLSKTFTITNNGTTALTGISLSIDGTHSSLFTVTTSPASSIAIGATSDFVVQFNASSAGAKTAALHIASSDSSVGAAFDIALTGTVAIPAPTITGITTVPTVPSDVDTPTVSATITPASGATITSATLTYSTGAQTTATIFNEPMSTTATTTGGWDGTGATYAWTVNSQDGAGNIKQTAGTSNHTTGITGSCGLVFSKGSAATTDPTRSMITTTNPINATGTFTSGSTTTNYVEFWVRTVGLTGTNGWSFQLAPNGTTFTERLSEFTASVHGYQLYHYDLQAADLTSTLKMRFGFVGNGVGGPTGSTVNIDDIVVVTTSGSAPTPVTMSGPANGGSFSAVIPSQVSGTTITYSIVATDSNGQTTTITNAGSYTTGPAPSITTGATLPNASGAYSQTLVASGGSGSGYTWSVNAGSTLPAGLTLSSAGVLSGTPTANGTFNFTLKVADSAGRIATRAFTLTISGANVTPPNVVIIVTDDQGWGDVGYHTPSGQVPIQTPNMDSFATTGIRLERFYATTVCSVTRSTLMTGRNAIRHGTNNERGLDLSEHLMPQTFKAAGYQTFMCGKWHLGGSDKNIYHFNVNGSPVRVIKEGLQYAPHNRGWDSFYGQYSGAIDYYTHNSAEAESLDIPDWWLNGLQQDGPSEHTDSRGYGGWSPTLLADKAIAHIQNRNPAQPMLLHLAFNSIHGPVSAPASLITKYQNLGVTNANRRLISAAVDGMDQEIGRVLAALDTAGIANNTLVVWFGDNGGDETKGSLNDPLRGTKGDSYEGGMREVAGIKWPGVLPAGVISNQYMWVGDVFPTLCAAVGVTPQNTKPLDGVNLWPALLSASNTTTVSRGSPLVTVSAAPIAIYQFTDPVNGGTKDFKLIRGRVNNVLTPELYNLTDDPQETTDLIANSAYASIVTTLTNAITAISVENMKPYVGPPLITNSVPQGGTIALYAPFTSWPGATPTVQWRKGGSNVAGGVVTQITDDLAVAVRGTYAATLTLTNVAPGDAGMYDVIVSNNVGSTTSDAGTLTVTAGGPTIANVSTGPTAPTYLDATYVLAQVTPFAGTSVAQVQLIYDNGLLLTNSIFSETMRTTAASPWTGDGCDNVWLTTPTSTTDISQTTNANHGAGNPCGLEFKRGTSTMGDRAVTTANSINAAGSAGYVEFWVATSNLTAGLGWTFQTSTDGTTWTTRLSEVDGTTHGFTSVYHYDLQSSELVSTLKLRFQFAGNGLGGASASKVQIDDLKVVTTAPAPPVTLAMFDDGNHGDGAANDGIWGAAIPAQSGGTTVNFHIVATDNNATSSTSPISSNYLYTVNNLLTDATIVGAEFLTLPKSDGVTLNLIASVNQQVFVEYGTAPGQYTASTAPTTFNIDNAKPEFKNPIRIPITGLQPDTEYYYRVRHRNVGAPFYSARGERSFHTARPRGTTFSFTVTADPHVDVNTDMQLFWRAMQNISLDQPDIHMDVGDIFMTDKLADGLLGVPPKWGGGVTINQTSINNRAIIFRNAFERACHSIPFFFGLGNHEAEYGYLFTAAADKQNNIPAWDLKARKAFYPAPTPDTFYSGNPTPKDYTGGTLGLLEDYYAFEWGEALFIMLDPFWNTMTNPNSANDAWHWSLGKPQYDWLKTTLQNSSARYKFVFMHHIVGGSTQAIINNVPTPQFAARGGTEVSDKYEWGGNNADGSPGFATKRPGWDMPIHDLLVQNKVNVVFHGHDHLYGYQVKDGIVYLECPQPGTPNYTSLGSAADGQYVNLGANSTSYLLPNSGHIRITVGPDQAVADYVRSYRTATDPMPPDATSVFNDETPTRINRSISHSFVLAPKISPPIEVANVAPGQVGLRWNAIPNKPYQIQWSTDLINWTTIDTLTFTNTNTNATYTDNLPARINGQRAFYRVMWNP